MRRALVVVCMVVAGVWAAPPQSASTTGQPPPFGNRILAHSHVGFVDQTPGGRLPILHGIKAPTPSPSPTPTTVSAPATSDYSGCLTAAQVAALLRAAGFPESAIPQMLAYAYRESHYCPGARNPSSNACGLFQIYPYQPGCLDAATNAHMAYLKYEASGFSPWGG